MTTNQAQAGIWGPMSATDDVLTEIAAERLRQDAKWGEQNHPDGTGEETLRRYLIAAANGHPAREAKDMNEFAVQHNSLTWALILLEEVLEALVERDPEGLREELIQVGAVAAAWAEAIDRRAKGGTK